MCFVAVVVAGGDGGVCMCVIFAVFVLFREPCVGMFRSELYSLRKKYPQCISIRLIFSAHHHPSVHIIIHHYP